MEKIEDSPSYKILLEHARLARKRPPYRPRTSLPIEIAAAEVDDMIRVVNEFRRTHATVRRTKHPQ